MGRFFYLAKNNIFCYIELYMYNNKQIQLIEHVQKKVEQFFADFPVPAHGYDHVARVTRRAREIAIAERANNVMLCELAGWLHDIGRVPEYMGDKSAGHHELSYILLKEDWFKNDKVLMF